MGDRAGDPAHDDVGVRRMYETADAASGGAPVARRRGKPRSVTKDVTDPAFPHHTERGYFRGCKGACCIEAKRRARARRDLLLVRGHRLTVPAGPVREHLIGLLMEDDAFSVAAIGRCVRGTISEKAIWHILKTHAERVRTGNADLLMKITANDVAREVRMVRVQRPHQQVASMMALGWPGEWISRRLGYGNTAGTGAPQFMYAGNRWMTKTLADRIDALAQEVGDRQGPSPITALRARKRGWRVPGAYDDQGNLIPGAALVDQRGRRDTLKPKDRRERNALIAEYTTAGHSAREIADMLGVNPRTVVRARSA